MDLANISAVDSALVELIRWMNRVFTLGHVELVEMVRLFEWSTNNQHLLKSQPICVVVELVHAMIVDGTVRDADRRALQLLNESVTRRADRRKLTLTLEQLLQTRRNA